MCDKIHNVLEPVTTGKYSVIKDIERVLEDNGAVRAFMTGSGPTVFAVYEREEDARKGCIKKEIRIPSSNNRMVETREILQYC